MPPDSDKTCCDRTVIPTVSAMSTFEPTGKFTMSVSLEAHQAAQLFRARQLDPAKGKQIYLNTIAVYAVHDYLQVLGIDSDLAASPSWDPVTQTLSDTGALQIGTQGQLECRPVLPEADSCHIPPDVWADRLGYVAVQLDAQLEQATLLGFLSQVSAETVPLSAFSQLEVMLDYVGTDGLGGIPTQLSRWLQGRAQAGWQMLDSLLIDEPRPALSFRNQSIVPPPVQLEIPGDATGGKVLDFSIPNTLKPLALLVGISPAENALFNIWVNVVPMGGMAELPPELDVSILDETNQAIMQAQARESKKLEFQFGGEVGDHFKIQLMLNNLCVTENFVV
ncbi:MAG: DUF1822 family protein [Cyanobacteria bacterium P01_A01_bin.15]